MKILITGSRKCNDVAPIFRTLNSEIKQGDVLIHGGAKGADSIAQSWAEQKDICTVIIEPIYYSKREYYLHRNAEMVGMCDRVIAFWDGKSRGTSFTINYAKKRKLNVKIIRIS